MSSGFSADEIKALGYDVDLTTGRATKRRSTTQGGETTVSVRHKPTTGLPVTSALGQDDGRSTVSVPRSPYRSKLEAEWAGYLEVARLAGEITSWQHEAITLKLARGVRFTPDFFVNSRSCHWTDDMPLEFHEVKGFMRDDARIKLRVAAQMYPCFRFKLVRKVKGKWTVEDV